MKLTHKKREKKDIKQDKSKADNKARESNKEIK